MKRCALCGLTKPPTDFHRAAKEPCGLKSRCKPCMAATAKTWKPRDPEKMDASVRRWQANNPEKVRAIAKANYERNREQYLIQKRLDYQKRREEILAAQRLRYQTDPEFRGRAIARAKAKYAETRTNQP